MVPVAAIALIVIEFIPTTQPRKTYPELPENGVPPVGLKVKLV
jgi:hypothetical protein